MPPSDQLLAEHEHLTRRAGMVRLAGRAHLRLTGADRASFLHALCTNDVKGLAAGDGCEALFLNASGKVLGHAYAFVGGDAIWLDAVPAQRAFLGKHLDFYHFREKVEFTDFSDAWTEWVVSGPEAPAAFEKLGIPLPPSRRLAHLAWGGTGATAAGSTADGAVESFVSVRKVDWPGPDGWSLAGPTSLVDELAGRLSAAGVLHCGEEAWEVVRVEAGTPYFGVDISSDNLPQEVARDSQLISFRKGCYLGQETVARIDSHGHVNRLLSGVKLEPALAAAGESAAVPLPVAGQTLPDEAKPLAVLTSVVYSPRLAAPFALAYVRRGRHAPGTRLDCHPWSGTVVELPLK